MVEGRIFLTTDAVGGVWQYSLDLARAYVQWGLDVDLAVVGPAPSSRLAEAQEIEGIEVIATGLPLDWTAKDKTAVRVSARELSGLANSRNAALVHLNCTGLRSMGRWSAPVVATLHSCVATWWQAVRHPEPLPPDLVWRTGLVAEGLRQADAVIVPSQAFAVAARGIYRDAAPLTVVRNGRGGGAEGRIAAAANDAVFTSGRLWDEAKNAAALDAAAAFLERPVWAAGPVAGPHGGEIALPHLRLLGELSSDGVRRRLARSGVFVSAALYEPFGLGVLEAAQHGCALVLSDIPTFRELWGGAARFVDPQRPRELARAVEMLSCSPQLRTEWGRRALQRSARFTRTDMAAGTLSVYSRVLRRRLSMTGGAA